MKTATWIALATAGIIPTVPVNAQTYGTFDMGMLTNTLSQSAVTNAETARASERLPLTRSLRFSAARSDATLPSSAQLSYRPSAAAQKQNFAQFIAQTRAVDPDSAGKLEHLLTSVDVMGEVQKQLGRYGMRTDNLADALAAYLASAWFATRASTDDPTPAQMQGLRNQVACAIGASPEFADATDAMKQQLAEANLIQAVIISGYAETAKAQPALRAQITNTVAEAARKAYGLDLRSMSLGDHGLVPD
ncbi:DUF6683 family protein [Novosphingobium beihaiensis]|uniref:Uncharacterized protein n=1 Tax=Novosphingobium beihaiensis TaxID=2930389 RepID=A0ABT0BVK0_9SPHN|nr:DUF6683 family protein [Novosphingobium beihaiensis]MCJ2189071.1 hypothetical protein [Novosphingobium beihaiensis]